MTYTTSRTYNQVFEDIERIVERINSKVPNMLAVELNESTAIITANNGKEIKRMSLDVYNAYSVVASLSHKVFND
ncbi:hypothetical protein [Bacteroides cellulosilyticus]|jgi:hypothetical protein|uniref:hypothetical protein n=1 Tax=Bacteroides cellulosilyticus TaxID=246787 RepID=UPI001D09617A|nr:hypothetical protein [Bacteroides cellulosilyticus]MCB6590922.1 hypothetical protein [Bacteroides cellulosilyticus]DAO48625.1 MAG TPA: hypothetical protein [Caudoviricetes sp.]